MSVMAMTSTATSAASPSRLQFQGLDSSQFRHPTDRDLTSFVRGVPLSGIAQDGLRRAASVLEQGVRLDLLSSSVKVSSDQLPDLYSCLLEACDILDIGGTGNDTTRIRPELYVQSNSQANAYTLAFQGKDTSPIIVVTSALLDRCTDAEVQAIIGHELGHIKCEHSLYLTLGSLTSVPVRTLLPFGIGKSLTDSKLSQWRLAAEYTCDRAALLVAQGVQVVNGAMLKLVSGSSHRNMSTEAFVKQCKEYDELLKSANPFVRASIQMQQRERTHPLPIKRVMELEQWSTSDEYTSILESAEP